MSIPEHLKIAAVPCSPSDAAEYTDTLREWLGVREAAADALARLVRYWQSGLIDPGRFEALYDKLNDLHGEQVRLLDKLREIRNRSHP